MNLYENIYPLRIQQTASFQNIVCGTIWNSYDFSYRCSSRFLCGRRYCLWDGARVVSDRSTVIRHYVCYTGNHCREMQEDTLKSLQIIPIDIPAMLLSKILLVLIFSAALYLILFLSAFIVEAILHVQVLSVGLFGRYLTMYCVEGLSVFIATLPVICIVIKTGQDYWMGLLIAEIYSFITIFVGNLGTVSKLYPIIAALTLSGYYESNYIEKLLSLLSMIACLLFSAFLIKEYSKKME